MITAIVDYINEHIKIEGAKIYGIAQSMIRKVGTEDELLPAMVDRNGDGKYCGLDDLYTVIIYHKVNSIISTQGSEQGFGDSWKDQVNTYQNSMYVYLDRKRLNKLPDEIYLYLQSVIPEGVRMEPFKKILIRFTSVILSSTQVFASEYQGTGFRIGPEKNLFAINYTVESTFKRGCFDKCL